MRKWPLKKMNHISTSFKRTFKMAKILEKSSTIMKNTNILKETCPKNVVLVETKNNIFLTFLDKNAIFCHFMFGDL